MHKALRRQCTLDIVIEPFLRRDGVGDPVYGEPHIEKGFLDGTVNLVMGFASKEVISKLMLFLPGEGGGVKLDDKITLPDGRTPRMININEVYDHLGNIDHLEIFL